MLKKKLTRRQLVKHIKETMPSEYNEYEQIAFIETEVAKQMAFDEQYYWGDSKTREQIYELAQRDAQTPKSEIKRKLICVTMAERFGYVLRKMGYNIKFQMRNKRDGVKSENGITIERLPETLVATTVRKVYGLKENEMFTDEYINSLAKRLIDEGKYPIEILQAFMQDSRIQDELQNTRCVEANKIYLMILKASYLKRRGILETLYRGLGSESEFEIGDNKALIDECILYEGTNSKKYSFCIYAEDRTQKVFCVYSKRAKKMIKLSPEEIKQIKNQSAKIALKPKGASEPELRTQMISYMNSAREGEMTNWEKPHSVSIEDIFYEEEELQ